MKNNGYVQLFEIDTHNKSRTENDFFLLT